MRWPFNIKCVSHVFGFRSSLIAHCFEKNYYYPTIYIFIADVDHRVHCSLVLLIVYKVVSKMNIFYFRRANSRAVNCLQQMNVDWDGKFQSYSVNQLYSHSNVIKLGWHTIHILLHFLLFVPCIGVKSFRYLTDLTALDMMSFGRIEERKKMKINQNFIWNANCSFPVIVLSSTDIHCTLAFSHWPLVQSFGKYWLIYCHIGTNRWSEMGFFCLHRPYNE